MALLCAINVGGTGKLKMSELRAACEAAGLEHVSTYIASGNIVFESAKSAPAVKGLITGSSVMAGTYTARLIVERLSVATFQYLLDGVMIISGAALLWAAIR